MYTLPWVPLLNDSSELTNSSQTQKSILQTQAQLRNTCRTTGLCIWILVFCLYLCLCLFPFSFCFAFIKPALSCSAVSWYERTEEKKSLQRHGSACCVGNTKKTLFLQTCTLPYLTQGHRPSIRILKHTSKRGMNDGVEEGHIVMQVQ